jgi:hypothetical protein
MSAATVPLPTAVGPARTVSRERADVVAGSATGAELALESSDLVGGQPADATALGDAQPLHHLAGADLAETGHRGEQVEHAHLADDLVLLPLGQDVDDRGPGVLEPVLDLGPLTAGRRGLLQVRLPLFRGEFRQRHGEDLDNLDVLVVGCANWCTNNAAI